MPASVTLSVTQGTLKGEAFRFDERSTCIMGRSKECHPQLPNDDAHRKISRHHCLLDINPPDIRVRDFGSLNGTYVNGKKIGQRRKDQSLEEAQSQKFPEYDLKEGDEIQLGDTIFRVEICVPAVCTDCGAEILNGRQDACRISGDLYRCDQCRDALARKQRQENAQRQADGRRRKAAAPGPQAKYDVCSVCGKDVSQEIGPKRHGDYVCLSCRKDPMKIIHFLIQRAGQGRQELVAIQGYTILKELGRGGMGAVYLAKHKQSGQQVALKVMLPEVASDRRSEQRFLRETALTKALKHPNVVQLYQHGCSDGTFFFTLEFCDGGSLDHYIARQGGKLPVDESLDIMLQLLDGLEYAHNVTIPDVELADGTKKTVRGLVHRDIKPGNFFLSGTGRQRVAKIADYGFAKAFDAAGLSGLTMTGSMAGTPPFMPRQQVINFKYAKPEVDVWAMAASLYNMLTGQIPRDFRPGKDPWMILLREAPVPVRQRDASIPKKLAEVIDSALIDNPAITFKTAADLKCALEGAM